jgi:hypothetical protein
MEFLPRRALLARVEPISNRLESLCVLTDHQIVLELSPEIALEHFSQTGRGLAGPFACGSREEGTLMLRKGSLLICLLALVSASLGECGQHRTH